MSRTSIDLSRNLTATGLSIGRQSAAFGFYYYGNVCEMVAYNRQLDAPTLNRVHAYLGNKWGITVYPTNVHPMYGLLPSTPAFSPIYAGGLVGWFDAADSNNMTFSNNVVTRWSNSAKLTDAIRTGALGGTYDGTTKGVTGYFKLTDDFLTTELNFFSVAYLSDLTTVFSFGPSLSQASASVSSQTMTFYSSRVPTPAYSAQTTFNTTASPNLIQCVADVSVWIFGVQVDLSGPMSGFNSVSQALVWSNTSNFFGLSNSTMTGTTHEVLIYNRVLEPAMRKRIEGYLAWKWNLTSVLPSNHPYKYVRPL